MTAPVPIINRNQRYTEWLLTELYTGPSGTGVWVPNVNDKAWDWTTGKTYRVAAVDLTTNLSTLVEFVPPIPQVGVPQNDVLLGAGPGTQSERYRCYINTAVTPFTLAVDAQLHIYDGDASYCKVFKGTDITSNDALVISALVDQNGDVTTENLGLTLVQTPGQNITGIKAVDQGYSTEVVADGSVVTAVIYNSSDVAISIATMLVKRTDFVRTTDASKKIISSIELLSSYISNSDNTLLELPVNMMLSSTPFQGKVHYTDGSSSILAVDGTRFALLGLDNYTATTVGQEIDLTLTYYLANNEYGNSVQTVGNVRFMTADYHITTQSVVGAYSVKIFAVPVWQNSSLGYRLEYYLYNLDRDAIYHITPYVSLVAPHNSFQPKLYGQNQILSLNLDLSSIPNAGYAYYVQTQTITVNLLQEGTGGNAGLAYWWVQYGNGAPQYGAQTNVQQLLVTQPSLGIYSFDLSAGFGSEADWLQALYYNANPLFSPTAEEQPPAPDHVRIIIGPHDNSAPDIEYDILVADWNHTINGIVTSSTALTQGGIAYLEFYQANGGDPLELGMGFLAIHMA